MLVLVSLFCVAIFLFYLIFDKDKNYWRKRNVVQVDGVMWKFITGNRSMSELHKEIYDTYSNEKFIGFFFGSKKAVLLKDLEDINFVTHGDIKNFSGRGIVLNSNDILADNILFINDYARWKLLRQKISPVFTQKKLKNSFYNLERCARDFIQFFEQNAEIRSKPFIALYTYATASISASIFGIDTQSKNVMDCPFMNMAWALFEPTLLDHMKFTLANYSPTLLRLLNLSPFRKFEKFFIGVFQNILESRRKSKETRHDFIDTCLELQESGILRDPTTGYEIDPTDEVLAAQAFFFFIAGSDPTASTMNYTLLELSYNPTILEKVHKEIDKVFKQCNNALSYEDMEKFVYLDMVINESMRKYPNIGLIQRECTVNTVLPSGLRIEKNTLTVTPIFAIHRDEHFYPEPELFDPERFAPNNVSNIVKNTYLPFGAGNHACIGSRLGRVQMKVGLAMLLHRYTLREQPPRQLHFTPSVFALREPNATYELFLRNGR